MQVTNKVIQEFILFQFMYVRYRGSPIGTNLTTLWNQVWSMQESLLACSQLPTCWFDTTSCSILSRLHSYILLKDPHTLLPFLNVYAREARLREGMKGMCMYVPQNVDGVVCKVFQASISSKHPSSPLEDVHSTFQNFPGKRFQIHLGMCCYRLWIPSPVQSSQAHSLYGYLLKIRWSLGLWYLVGWDKKPMTHWPILEQLIMNCVSFPKRCRWWENA